MNAALRWTGSFGLLAAASFCVFGFLASFEAGILSFFHLVYAALGIGGLAGAIRLLTLRSRFRDVLPMRRQILLSIVLFPFAVLLLWLWAQLRG